MDGAFLYVTDARGDDVGWALLAAPVFGADEARLAELVSAGYRFAGMPSYLDFPRRAPHGAAERCEAWLHPFRAPDRYLPRGTPRALLSHSDFTDVHRLERMRLPAVPASHDFVFVGCGEHRVAKNWPLAGRCIPRLCRELGLRALVVGEPCPELPERDGIEFAAPLEWPALLAHLASARFLLAPNSLDPSPRVIAEALCMDLPVVVNRRILGGWKYVNAFTGEFFDDERDVTRAAARCLARPRAPRRWFRANAGAYVSGARLLRVLRSLDPRISESDHLLVIERPVPGR
jgi:glycosyltransferase involved in cell wall biosynthesis